MRTTIFEIIIAFSILLALMFLFYYTCSVVAVALLAFLFIPHF